MNHFLKVIGLALILSVTAEAKTKVKEDYSKYLVPEITEATFDDPDFLKQKKEWSKLKRKLASDMSFSGSDLSSDFKKLRDEWLKCSTGDEMEALLKKSYANEKSFSEDTRYFLAQMHTILPLRGIIWKLRPLFENSKGFLGNKSTHVAAVQAVRTAITALKTFLPTDQTEAAIQYFTEPSVEMSKADQFHSVAELQKFLMEKFVPVLTESITKLEAMARNNEHKVYVWDNKMAFGTGSFEDEIQRFVGHGPAEMNFAIATMYRSLHNIMFYCAYNQDYSIKLAGKIGSHLGIDSTILASKKADLGLSDEERVSLVKSAARKHKFLELRNYDGSNYGSRLMKEAYKALKNSVVYAERSYHYLQGREASQSMGLNPILFQQDVAPNLDKGIMNMKAVVSGAAEVRDPVTGDTVTINLPALYNEPPAQMTILSATKFEQGPVKKVIKNKKGEALEVRNYLSGRSIAWDNNAWKKYVPSAEGKGPGYMQEARRIIKYSFGTSMVFGLPDLFVH